jgi:hypothetical protein
MPGEIRTRHPAQDGTYSVSLLQAAAALYGIDATRGLTRRPGEGNKWPINKSFR